MMGNDATCVTTFLTSVKLCFVSRTLRSAVMTRWRRRRLFPICWRRRSKARNLGEGVAEE